MSAAAATCGSPDRLCPGEPGLLTALGVFCICFHNLQLCVLQVLHSWAMLVRRAATATSGQCPERLVQAFGQHAGVL
jgi:hypothetical protein